MTEPGEKPVLRRTLEEHEELRRELREFERLAEQIRGSRERLAELMEELLQRLEAIRPRLEAHFELEEAEGLHEEILEAMPHASRRVTELLHQHSELLEALGELTSIASTLRDMAQVRLYGRIAHLLDKFRKHEEEERVLFLEALENGGPGLD
jgi:chromosome segregation ATPase